MQWRLSGLAFSIIFCFWDPSFHQSSWFSSSLAACQPHLLLNKREICMKSKFGRFALRAEETDDWRMLESDFNAFAGSASESWFRFESLAG